MTYHSSNDVQACTMETEVAEHPILNTLLNTVFGFMHSYLEFTGLILVAIHSTFHLLHLEHHISHLPKAKEADLAYHENPLYLHVATCK